MRSCTLDPNANLFENTLGDPEARAAFLAAASGADEELLDEVQSLLEQHSRRRHRQWLSGRVDFGLIHFVLVVFFAASSAAFSSARAPERMLAKP